MNDLNFYPLPSIWKDRNGETHTGSPVSRLTSATRGTLTRCLSPGKGRGTGPETVSSRLNSGSAFHLLALSPWPRYRPSPPESGENNAYPPSSELLHTYELNNMIFQSVRYGEHNNNISFFTVHPNHNIMEGFSSGGSPHPVLCGLLCGGKVISVQFLLFCWEAKQIKGLIFHRCLFF